MKITIATVGKIRTKAWQMAEVDFAQRLKRYADFSAIVVKEADQKALRNDELVKAQEGELLLSKVAGQGFVVALDENGTSWSSEQLAGFLEQKASQGQNKVCFVVGGPLGLSLAVIGRADLVLSLSAMTLPHELAKVVLMEQIYRAFTIIRGEKYHKA